MCVERQRDGRTRRLARHGTSPCDAGLTPELGKLFSLERLRLFLGLFLESYFSFCIRSNMCQYRMPVRMLGVQRRSTIYMYNARRSFSELRLDNRHLEIDNSNDLKKNDLTKLDLLFVASQSESAINPNVRWKRK